MAGCSPCKVRIVIALLPVERLFLTRVFSSPDLSLFSLFQLSESTPQFLTIQDHHQQNVCVEKGLVAKNFFCWVT